MIHLAQAFLYKLLAVLWTLIFPSAVVIPLQPLPQPPASAVELADPPNDDTSITVQVTASR